jgi:integrase
MVKGRKKRIPGLSYTDNRGIGYYVAYRDPRTNRPTKHRFGKINREAALEAYHDWLAAHLKGQTPSTTKASTTKGKLVEQIAPRKAKTVEAPDVAVGSLLDIAKGMLQYDESRVRGDDAQRAKGTIKRKQYESIHDLAHAFLAFLNTRHGQGAVARLQLTDLTMDDVEKYNALLVQSDYSSSQVRKRLQVVKSIIDRGGRREHGGQVLQWNWDSRDVLHGRPDKPVTLPTVTQLKLILKKCDVQRTAQVWMALGLGFGQGDLSVARIEHFDKDSYDMRRGKTGIGRFGTMPPLVWHSIQRYLAETPRKTGELLFLTEDGFPLVHGKTDSIAAWWSDLRDSLGEDSAGLNGFYSLRHTGASEYGSRPGCSISAMRTWLGHSKSSAIADRYMQPISPENKAVIEWVRRSLQSDRANLRLKS